MGKKARKRQARAMREMNQMSQEQFEYYKQQQADAQAQVDVTREQYEDFEFFNPYEGAVNPFADLTNPYANVTNAFEGMGNVFEGMENVFEDATVDQRAADFQRQMADQSRANILQTLQASAGGSGIGGLAQILANQGAIQSQQIAASIAQQERQNQLMAAQESARIDQLQRTEAGRIDQLQRATDLQLDQQFAMGEMQLGQLAAQGEFQTQAMILGGDAMVQQAEAGRLATILGMDYGLLTGANTGVSQAMANQMSGMGMMANMYGSQAQGTQNLIGNLAMAAAFAFGSDRRLKKNISLIGKSSSGLNIYSFEYIDGKYGKGLFQGVMSDEIPKKAVIKMKNGYDAVNYSMLDVEFKRI